MSDDIEDHTMDRLARARSKTRVRYSRAEWTSVKDFIQSYYVDENHTLPQLQAKLAHVYDFRPT